MRKSDHQTETSTSAASCGLLFHGADFLELVVVAPWGIVREQVHTNATRDEQHTWDHKAVAVVCVCVNGRKLVGVGDKEGMFRTKEDVDARTPCAPG